MDWSELLSLFAEICLKVEKSVTLDVLGNLANGEL